MDKKRIKISILTDGVAIDQALSICRACKFESVKISQSFTESASAADMFCVDIVSEPYDNQDKRRNMTDGISETLLKNGFTDFYIKPKK